MRKNLLLLTKPLAPRMSFWTGIGSILDFTGTFFSTEVHAEELRVAMKNITTVKEAWQAIGIYSHTNNVANK